LYEAAASRAIHQSTARQEDLRSWRVGLCPVNAQARDPVRLRLTSAAPMAISKQARTSQARI